jgi:hypothetical protein
MGWEDFSPRCKQYQVTNAQGLLERLPVDRKTEPNQGMAHVNQLLEIHQQQLPAVAAQARAWVASFFPSFQAI